MKRSAWEQLRLRGMPERASASAQIAALVDFYLDGMSQAQCTRILASAAETSRGRKGRNS